MNIQSTELKDLTGKYAIMAYGHIGRHVAGDRHYTFVLKKKGEPYICVMIEDHVGNAEKFEPLLHQTARFELVAEPDTNGRNQFHIEDTVPAPRKK